VPQLLVARQLARREVVLDGRKRAASNIFWWAISRVIRKFNVSLTPLSSLSLISRS